MKEPRNDLLKGTLDLLVLQSLSLGPLHGLGVSDRIAQITKGAFNVKPGSLFPALHRLEAAGRLSSKWGASENNRRAKYYKLTRTGRKQLEGEVSSYNRLTEAIAKVLQTA